MTAKNCENIRVVLVGDCGVGKTTYLKQLANFGYVSEYYPTNGIKQYDIWIKDKKIRIRDIAGKEKHCAFFRYLAIRGADVVMIFLDMTNYLSYTHGVKWVNWIKEIQEDIYIIIIGTKSDSKFLKWKSPPKDLHEFPFIVTSSRLKSNIEIPFLYI